MALCPCFVALRRDLDDPKEFENHGPRDICAFRFSVSTHIQGTPISELSFCLFGFFAPPSEILRERVSLPTFPSPLCATRPNVSPQVTARQVDAKREAATHSHLPGSSIPFISSTLKFSLSCALLPHFQTILLTTPQDGNSLSRTCELAAI